MFSSFFALTAARSLNHYTIHKVYTQMTFIAHRGRGSACMYPSFCTTSKRTTHISLSFMIQASSLPPSTTAGASSEPDTPQPVYAAARTRCPLPASPPVTMSRPTMSLMHALALLRMAGTAPALGREGQNRSEVGVAGVVQRAQGGDFAGEADVLKFCQRHFPHQPCCQTISRFYIAR